MNDPQPQAAVFRPALALVSGRLLGFIAAFAIPVVLARAFDPAQFGTYKQLFLIYATLFGIAQAGMAESLYYFLPRNAARGGAFVLNALLALAVLGALCLAILWWQREAVAGLLNNPALADFLPYLGFYLLFMLMAVVLEIVLTVRKRYAGAATAYAVTDFVRAAFYLVPVLLFANLHALMLGALGFAALRFTAAAWYVRSAYGNALTADPAALRAHLGYALPFGLAALIEVLQLNLHLYAVAYFVDAATFAIYAVGCLQIPLTDFLVTSTSSVMMVNMRERLMEDDLDSVVAIWRDSVRKVALVFFPVAVCLLVLARPLIVLLFTDTYRGSVPIFMIWTLSMLFAALLTDGVLRVFAETRFLIVQNLVRLGLVLATIHWFIAQMGLIGAVLVTLLTTTVSKLLALARIKSVMRVSLGQLLPWRSLAITLLIAGGAAVPALLLRSVARLPDVMLLLATGLVYSSAYYALLLCCGPMQRSEKRMLSQWLQFPFLRLSRAWKS
jgi:O-antigen/teichoic acid export membrane protein